MSRKTVLVTGSTGFLGKNLLAALTQKNYSLKALVRKTPQERSEKVNYQLFKGMTEVTDWSSYFDKVDVVVHCAARVHILSETEENPLEAFRNVNVKASVAMAKAARNAGVKRFIYISSIGVNGAETHESPFNNDTKAAPYSPYTQSKYEAEQKLLAIANESSMDIVVIRPPLIYGPDAPGNFQKLLAAVEKGIPMPFGNSKNRRSFIAVANLTSFISACIEHPKVSNKVMVVADKTAISTGQLIKAIASAYGKGPRLFSFPSGLLRFGLELIGKKGLAQQLCGSLEIDSQASCQILDWNHPTSLEETLAQIVKLKNQTGDTK